MSQPDDRERRIQELEERLSRLSEASLRINESLDFETVLQNALDSARDLTGARYGVIATVDEQGGLETILTSGTSEEEHQQVVALEGGEEIFAHFVALADPVRVDGWGAYAASVELNGVLPMPVWAGLTAPIRYRGESEGVIFVGHDEEEWRFSTEDEEILLMFAELAANAGRGADLPAPAGAGLEQEGRWRRAPRAHHRQQAPPQARRGRRQPPLHLHRAPRRLRHARGNAPRHARPGRRLR
ncbi:MAG: GAF domain-containing protein [Dehalococcoidia bacterium]|nr:GAF domain-containing protein [Dehalococcoidia bacterium]